jgi:hypothetical protein
LVQCVCFDGSDYINHRACSKGYRGTEEGFENWTRCNAGHGLYFSEEGQQKFLAGFSPEQLKAFYETYCQHIDGQRFLRQAHIERGIRRYAMARFATSRPFPFMLLGMPPTCPAMRID